MAVSLMSKLNWAFTMMTLTPYLLFDGTCGEAMEFYQARLGGDLNLVRVSESVLINHMPAGLQNKVLSARLKGNGFDISASDWMVPDRKPERAIQFVCTSAVGRVRS